ncbi:YihY family inner membrane protein [Frateuria aurantia]
MALKIDRKRVFAFLAYAWERFVADKCFESAGALAYTTLVSLVPLMVAMLAMFSVFPVFEPWRQTVEDFVFNNVPAAGTGVRDALKGFASNASQLTGISILAMLFSAISMMVSIEDRMNRIWRVHKPRSWVSRVFLYWTALTLGPILTVGSLAAMSYAVALPLLHRAAGQLSVTVGQRALWLLPFVVTFASLWLLYALVPNGPVRRRYATAGALIGAILFEWARAGFGIYVAHAQTYERIYGTLAALPIFLLWIYLSWVIVILGASLAASMASFEYHPKGSLLPAGAEFLGLLVVLGHFVTAQRQGRPLTVAEVNHAEPALSRHDTAGYFEDLDRSGIIRCSPDDGWVMIRSLDSTQLLRLYRDVHYRLPLSPREEIEQRGINLPEELMAVLDTLAAQLRGSLAVSLERIFPVSQGDTPADLHRTINP